MIYLKDNPYIKSHSAIPQEINLNDYMYGTFSGLTAGKKCNIAEFTNALSGLFSILGFNIHMFGYSYLFALVRDYLIYGCVDTNIKDSVVVRTPQKHSNAEKSIKECVSNNSQFLGKCAFLLGEKEIKSAKTIKTFVELIGALFNIYFNLTVSEKGPERIEEHTINIGRYYHVV